MKSTDQLFNLIKTMSKSEKGYLRKFSGLHSDQKTSKYMLLFDAIDKQEVYDEAKIKRKFRNERFVKQFPVAKNYLYNLILKCLASYQQNVDAELFQLYRESQILSDRGLDADALKLVLKMKQKASENERFQLFLLAQRQELNLSLRSRDSSISLKNDELLSETKKVAELILNQAEYQWNYNRLFDACERVGNAITSAQVKDLKLLDNEFKHLNEKSALSKTSLRDFYKAREIFFSTVGDKNQMYEYSKKHIDLIKQHPNIFNASFHYQLVSFFNMANACISVKHYDEALKYVAEIEKLKPLSKKQEALIFTHTLQPKLTVYMELKKYQRCAVVIAKATEQYARLKDYISPLMSVILPFEIAYIEFVMGDYKQALRWANIIINEKKAAVRYDLLDKMNVFELLIHYELNNTMVLDYRIKSAKKKLQKEHSFMNLAPIVIKYLKQLTKTAESEKASVFIAFKKELSAVFEKAPQEADFLNYVDLITWIDSKLQKMTMFKLIAQQPRL